MLSLESSVSQMNRIGKVLGNRLDRLGIRRVQDLLFHLPFRYEDFSDLKKISELVNGENVTIEGEVIAIHVRRTRRKNLTLVEGAAQDETGQIKFIWFNQPFLKDVLIPGKSFLFSGKIEQKGGLFVMKTPVYEEKKEGQQVHTKGVIPVYPTTDKLTQKQIRFLLDQAFSKIGVVQDNIPEKFLEKHKLCSLGKALKKVHFPENWEDVELGRKRISYEQLFWMQAGICSLKQQLQQFYAEPILFSKVKTKEFINNLPFQLTDSQKKVSWKILQEMEDTKPMNRLVQGDVGSGKTMIALLALINTSWQNLQSAFLVPTEILAQQHFLGTVELVKSFNIPVLLLTRSHKKVMLPGDDFWNHESKLSEKEALRLIQETPNLIVIGTHSLLEEKVKFSNLGLVVVDEQHRFGVKQRSNLKIRFEKNNVIPHYLSMTATPIPRTQALFLYGDLDLSLIGEMPKGRKVIVTKVIQEKDKRMNYAFIRSEIQKGRQVFVVCSLIDPSDNFGAKSVQEVSEHLKKEFSEFSVSVLHGRMKGKEKEEVMRQFKNKEFDILVSTSVVEVGVDVPNATVMMIEGAERFGLSQLHQFRGRVGRGEYQSYCFLLPSEDVENIGRLKVMEKISNGFDLAQKDLEYRGPGQVYGYQQSGVLGEMESLGVGYDQESLDWVEEIRADVLEILEDHKKNGDHLEIVEKIKKHSQDIHLE